jgi:hypothetical protein
LRVVQSCAEFFTPVCSAAALHRLATYRGASQSRPSAGIQHSVVHTLHYTAPPELRLQRGCPAVRHQPVRYTKSRCARAGEKDLDSEAAASQFALLERLIVQHAPSFGCTEISNVVWAYGALGSFFGSVSARTPLAHRTRAPGR